MADEQEQQGLVPAKNASERFEEELRQRREAQEREAQRLREETARAEQAHAEANRRRQRERENVVDGEVLLGNSRNQTRRAAQEERDRLERETEKKTLLEQARGLHSRFAYAWLCVTLFLMGWAGTYWQLALTVMFAIAIPVILVIMKPGWIGLAKALNPIFRFFMKTNNRLANALLFLAIAALFNLAYTLWYVPVPTFAESIALEETGAANDLEEIRENSKLYNRPLTNDELRRSFDAPPNFLERDRRPAELARETEQERIERIEEHRKLLVIRLLNYTPLVLLSLLYLLLSRVDEASNFLRWIMETFYGRPEGAQLRKKIIQAGIETAVGGAPTGGIGNMVKSAAKRLGSEFAFDAAFAGVEQPLKRTSGSFWNSIKQFFRGRK